MAAPDVVVLIVTFCGPAYVPAVGLKAGAATCCDVAFCDVGVGEAVFAGAAVVAAAAVVVAVAEAASVAVASVQLVSDMLVIPAHSANSRNTPFLCIRCFSHMIAPWK
jgi:hypothetical protein